MPAHKKTVVAVSGGFDPVHIGHVRMFEEAKKLGDELVVILNNDNWLNLKKGYSFMEEKERKEIIEAFTPVDRVLLSFHEAGTTDMSVCKELEYINPDIFANGGDRKPDDVPVPEVGLCERLGIEMVYNIGHGGKVQSSSWLTKKVKEQKEKAAHTAAAAAAVAAAHHAPTHSAAAHAPAVGKTTTWWLAPLPLVFLAFAVLVGLVDVVTRIYQSFF